MPEAVQAQLDQLLEGLNEPQREAVVARRGAAARPRRRRVGQDPRADPPDRPSAGHRRRAAARDPRHHVHEQGRGRDARARRGPRRPPDPRDVGDDVPRGVRADAPRRGAAAGLHEAASRSTTRPTRAGWSSTASTSSGSIPSASRRAAIHNQISDAKNKLRDAESYGQMVGSYFEQTVADVFRLYESELHRVNAMDFDDLLVRAVNVLELFPEVRAPLRDHLPLRAGRRVPGHEPRPVPLAAAALEPRRRRCGRRPRQPDGRRRRRPVGLQLPRRRHPQHPRLRGRLPRRQGRQARAELPLDADHPRRPPTPSSPTTAGARASRCGPIAATATRSSCASSTTSTPRRATWPGRSSSSSTRGPRARRSRSSTGPTRSRACWRSALRRSDLPYQVVGGVEVLRPRRGQGRAGLPDAPRQPAGRGRLRARRQLPQARAGPDVASPASSSWANTTGQNIWDAAVDPEAIPQLGTAARKALDPLHGHDARAARAGRDESPGGRAARGDPARVWLSRRARGRAHVSRPRAGIENLEALVEGAREYDGTAEEPSLPDFLQQLALRGDADEVKDGARLGDADVAPHRQGPRVPVVFMIGMEDGIFPHSRALDEGQVEEERRLAYVGITRAMRELDADLRAAAQRLRRRDRAACPRASCTSSRRPDRARGDPDLLGDAARGDELGLDGRGGRAGGLPPRRRRRATPPSAWARSSRSSPAGSSSCTSASTATASSSPTSLRWRRRERGDHRRQGGRAGGPGARSPTRSPAWLDEGNPRRAWPPCSSATTRPRRSTWATRQGLRGGRDRALRPPAGRRRRRGERSPRLLDELERRPGGQRDPAPAAGARRRLDGGAELTGPDRPAVKDVDGLTPSQRRAARPGHARAAALHAAGRDRAARRRRRRARGRQGGRRRPLRPRRQAGGAAAARAQRDGDGLPLAHARPRRRSAGARRRADRRRRAAAVRQGRLGQARAPW